MPSQTTQVCVVTGASNGIGLATASKFASAGYRLSICGRREDVLQSAAGTLGHPESVLAMAGDIGDAKFRQAYLDQTLDRFGQIDVLVNNAGAAPLGNIESIDKATFESVIDTNIRAVFSLTQKVWSTMKENGGGAIVNISSLAAIDPFPGFSIYGASKAWIETFTRALAAEGDQHAIRACCVRPGAVETDLLRGLFPDFPADECVSPAEVANKVWQCVSDPQACPSGEAFTVRK